MQLCFGQKCLPVADLKIPECPVGNGGMICSGQLSGVSTKIITFTITGFVITVVSYQICNNLGLCSCLRGFMGQACSETLIPPGKIT